MVDLLADMLDGWMVQKLVEKWAPKRVVWMVDMMVGNWVEY